MVQKCSVEGCEKGNYSTGLCHLHYYRKYASGKIGPAGRLIRGKGDPFSPCSVEGCERNVQYHGLCTMHATRYQRWGDPTIAHRVPNLLGVCEAKSCEIPMSWAPYCRKHATNIKKYGKPEPSRHRKCPEGTLRLDAHGYIRIKQSGHPNAYRGGWLLRHTQVMSVLLGRPLLRGENVHHRNGVKTDNRPENLELWVSSQPSGQRVPDLVAWATEILRRYGTIEERMTTQGDVHELCA